MGPQKGSRNPPTRNALRVTPPIPRQSHHVRTLISTTCIPPPQKPGPFNPCAAGNSLLHSGDPHYHSLCWYPPAPSAFELEPPVPIPPLIALWLSPLLLSPPVSKQRTHQDSKMRERMRQTPASEIATNHLHRDTKTPRHTNLPQRNTQHTQVANLKETHKNDDNPQSKYLR
ncbi:hypothetical protein CKAH01_16640 [Colletotrichum kahawae]|uniref:Uncharacterized protein n=1 Tax=Colletotrichum kahawae TaxID=34407 RepID=A0AAD9YDS0_COLKA|nr:hypothetical protein CKAH01_16640 [Colletotrichum kahawae]